MRNISFALTTEQIRKQTKTVTRRIGSEFLKHGDLLQPVEKCQGLKNGERMTKIGGPIRVVSVRREPLSAIQKPDVIREGFPNLTAAEFVDFFCRNNRIQFWPELGERGYPHRRSRPCQPSDEVTRIEFEDVKGAE